MSYTRTRQIPANLRSYPVRSSGGLRSALGEAFGGGEVECVNRANASPQVAAIDAEIVKLQKTWNPTGYYTPKDVQTIIDTIATETAAAGEALRQARYSTSTSDQITVINAAFDDLIRRSKDRSFTYINAVAMAQKSGVNVVNAPGLKDWVISSMRAISDAYVTVTVLRCRQGWVLTWLERGYKAMAAIGAVAARILGVVYKLGEAAVNAAEKAGDLAAFIIKYAPYAAVGLGGYLLYNSFKKRSAG